MFLRRRKTKLLLTFFGMAIIMNIVVTFFKKDIYEEIIPDQEYQKNIDTHSNNHKQFKRNLNNYVDSYFDVMNGILTPVEKVISKSDETINIGAILINIKQKQDFLESKFANDVRKNFGDIIDKAKRKPLHFIIVTDKFSSKEAGLLISSLYLKRISQHVLTNVYRHPLDLVPIHISLVDYADIKAKKPEFTNTFNGLKGTNVFNKYNHDLYYIAPLYHLAFTKLDRMIVLDGQDLEVRIDIAELNDKFEEFKSTEIIGIGNDLSPFYWSALKNYTKKNPGTQLGKPGRFQGFNSGVVLYDFKKMRKNEIFNRYLETENMLELLSRFMYKSILAEQDWFTNLGFSYPELFYLLPCTYNGQVGIEMMTSEFRDVFDDYHFCDKASNFKVLHKNGCYPELSNCGRDHPEINASKKYLEGAYDTSVKSVVTKIDWMLLYNMSYSKNNSEGLLP